MAINKTAGIFLSLIKARIIGELAGDGRHEEWQLEPQLVFSF